MPGLRLLYSAGDPTVRAPATFALTFVSQNGRSVQAGWSELGHSRQKALKINLNQVALAQVGSQGRVRGSPGALAPPSDRAGARGAMSEMGACRRARYCVATGSGLAYARFGLADGQSHQPPTEEPDHNLRERLPVSTTPQRSSAQESATAIGAYLFAGRVMSSRVPAVAS